MLLKRQQELIFISPTDFSAGNYDNGYSLAVASIYHFNETVSLTGTLSFHRAEGSLGYSGVTPAVDGYSIDNPDKPNIYAYEVAVGLRANFSEKMVKPYFAFRTGFLFTNVSYRSISNFYQDDWYNRGWKENHRIAFYLSPGLGLNFTLLDNLNFLIEARFNIITGTDYSFIPITTGIQYEL